jgi:hypothetical protein
MPILDGGAPAPAAPAPTPAPAAAAPAAPAPAPAPGGPAPVAGDWFPPDHKSLVEAKGWKTPADALTSYANLQKLVGVDPSEIIKMPKPDDAEGWKALHAKLGAPASADGYTLPEPLAKDPMALEFRNWAHEAGLSPKQAEAILTGFTASAAKNQEALVAAAEAAQTQRLTALQKEVGEQEWPTYVEDARRAARVLLPDEYKDPATGQTLTRQDISQKLEDALGVDLAVRIMQTAGKFHAEDKVEGGVQRTSGIMSGDSAQAEKARLRGDKNFMSRWANGDAEARAQMKKLDAAIVAEMERKSNARAA